MSADPDNEAEQPGAGAPRGLARRFFVGGLYLSFGSWVTSALNFVIGLLIARMLGPEILGFYALVFSVNEVLNVIGAFSLGLAVVQQPEESETLYDTALGISALLGGLGLLAALGMAPLLGYLHSREAAWFIVVLGLARLLALMAQVPTARLERGLRYGTVAGINAVTLNVPNLCALALAWLGAGAASLLAKDALTAVLALALPLLFARLRFHGRIDRSMAARLMSFSRPMFVARTLEIVVDRVDRLLVGSLLGDLRLGLYNQARVLAETGSVAMRPLSPLTFNLYSRLQDDPPRLSRAYGIVNYFLARIVFAGAVVLLVYPAPTIRLLLGDEWIPAAPLLRWLALYAALLPIFENMKTVLYGRGAVREVVWVRVAQLALFVPGVLAASLLGSVGAVAASLLAVTAAGALWVQRANRGTIERGMARVLVVPALCCGAVAAGFGGLAWSGFSPSLPFWALPFLPALAYGGLLLLVERGRLLSEFLYLRGLLQRRDP